MPNQSAASSAQWEEAAGVIAAGRLPMRMGLAWDAALGSYVLAEGSTTPGFVLSGGTAAISAAPDATDTLVRAAKGPDGVTFPYGV